MDVPVANNKGVVLPVILWFVVIAVAVVATGSASTMLNVRTADNLKSTVLMKYAAESGVYRSIYLVHNNLVKHVNASSIQTVKTHSNGYLATVYVIPESMKLDINRIGEKDIDRIINEINKAEFAGGYTSVLNITKAFSDIQNNLEYRQKPRYSTVDDIDARGLQAGMRKNLSVYMTVYANSMNVYSLYSTLTGNNGDHEVEGLVVYAVINRTENSPFHVLEWKS